MRSLFLLFILSSAFAVPAMATTAPGADQTPPAVAIPTDSAMVPQVVQPKVPSITLEELNRKRLQRLQELSRDLQADRSTIAEFDAYLNWMGGALAGYSKYVEAGSFAAGFAKFLPVPYAGQVGQATKFISHFALSLSATSMAIKSYMNSSRFFIGGVEALGTNAEGKEGELSMLTFYADQQLSRDMVELRTRLASVSELSGSALSFLLGLQQYLGSTDEYWQKTKSFVSRKDADKGDKGAVALSIDGLRSKAESFNSRLKKYEATVNSTVPRIASLVAFDEIRQEMEAKSSPLAARDEMKM